MKCPRCHKKVVEVIGHTTFEVVILTTKTDDKMEYDMDELTSGYNDLYDWLENMLVETKFKAEGCKHCLKG